MLEDKRFLKKFHNPIFDGIDEHRMMKRREKFMPKFLVSFLFRVLLGHEILKFKTMESTEQFALQIVHQLAIIENREKSNCHKRVEKEIKFPRN